MHASTTQFRNCDAHMYSKVFIKRPVLLNLVYDRNHLFGLGFDTETETENWPKLQADTETNQNHKISNWKAVHQGVCKNFSIIKTFIQYTNNKYHVNQLRNNWK